MASGNTGHKGLSAIAQRGRRGLRAAGFIALVVTALAAAIAVSQFGTANAAGGMSAGLDVLETGAGAEHYDVSARAAGAWDLGKGAMTASWPAMPENSNVSGLDPGDETAPALEVYVWAEFMTVGTSTDGTTTYTGWIPGATEGSEGSLTGTSFTYGDTDYNVLTLFHQYVEGSIQQIVFTADKQLPDNLVFYAGNLELRVSESLKLGAGRNIHAWRLDSHPGWSEGDRIPVVLGEGPVTGLACE